MTRRRISLFCTGLALVQALTAADFPKTELSNGKIQATIAMPDQEKSFYRGTRFDWLGMIYNLSYDKHEFYGPWFQSVSGTVHDFVYQGKDIVASPCTAATGPAEEFVEDDGTALGYAKAKAGGTFIKIGVGVLRKPNDAAYDHFKLYEVTNGGQFEVKRHADSVGFSQRLEDSGSGYAYLYNKTIRLVPGKPEMRIEHTLRNLGNKEIRTDVYNHNFLRIDGQAPGPDYSLTVPFEIKSAHPPDARLAQIRGNRLVYLKALEGQDRVTTPLEGFGATAKDYHVEIDNRKTRAGLRVSGDRPLQREFLWSIRAVLCVEPYIRLLVPKGGAVSWTLTYEYNSQGTVR